MILRHLFDATGNNQGDSQHVLTTLSTHHMNTCPTAVLMNVVQSCVRHFATIWKATSEWELCTSKRIKFATLAYILGDSYHPASSFETTSVTQDAGGVKWIQRFTHISSRCFSMLYICMYARTHISFYASCFADYIYLKIRLYCICKRVCSQRHFSASP